MHAQEQEIDGEIPAEDSEVRFYLTPEERLEAGFRTPLTEWLFVSGLLEIEKFYRTGHFSNHTSQDEYEPRTQTLQIGFDADFSDTLAASVVFEAEYQEQFTTTTEEAVLAKEFEGGDIEIGYMDLPFGEYYSNFVSGPMLEFGETTATALVGELVLNDGIDLIGYVFDGRTRHNGEQDDPGWGAGLDYSNEEESIRIGAGILSNLAESDEELLADFDNEYVNRVPAWNVNALFGFEDFLITVEAVGALKSFAELDAQENKPFAWNLEGAWFYNHQIQLALRLGYSRELADNPQWQFGIVISWRPDRHWALTAEYLRNDYINGIVTNDDDIGLEYQDQFGLQISFEF